MELDEEGQHVKCTPVLVDKYAELKSAVALQVEQLKVVCTLPCVCSRTVHINEEGEVVFLSETQEAQEIHSFYCSSCVSLKIQLHLAH